MDMPSYLMGKRAGGGTMIETDPIYSSSPASGITTEDITNWNNKSDFSGNYNDLSNKPTIPAEVTETTVANWGFTKNTGDYSKPSGGIPSSDLDSSVQTSLGKADTALQSETYTGTITSVKMNGNTVATSGEADLGTVITQHQDISGKQDVIQYSTMPTASVDNLGDIVQYTGTTDSTYTNGYFYKCVSDGADPATYSWEEVEVQAGGGGATYTAGTNISIDSNNAINCDIPYTGGNYNGFGIGEGITTLGSSCIAIGYGAKASAPNMSNASIAIGYQANSWSKSIAIGRSANSNAKENSIAIGNNASNTKNNQAIFGSSANNINEIAMYTSSGIKVMATEDFVTGYLATLTGYDATKTQVLKNVSGTLTWVDE